MSKKTTQTETHHAPTEIQLEHHVGKFSLSFLEREPAMATSPPVYEYELLTVEEKAAYYDDLVRSHGKKNAAKIAKDCRRKAASILKQASRLEHEEAKPLLWKASGLEALALGLENPRSEERRVGKECRSRWSSYH